MRGNLATALAALLVVGTLCMPSVQAQPGAALGGATPGAALTGGHSVGPATRGRFSGGAHRGGARHRGGRNRGDLLVAPLWYDYWDDWYEEPFVDYEQPQPPPPVLMPPRAPEPVRMPAAPKLVEIPGANTAVPKKLPPAIFVLSNGERIEAQRYLITADNVQINSGRQLRTIPLNEVDLAATVAANRQRGIDLHIPADGGEISLGF